jgi:hypothetical protein
MSNEELETAFDDAAERWSNENPMIDRRMARYFFFAGSTFGTQAVGKLYGEFVKAIEPKEAK